MLSTHTRKAWWQLHKNATNYIEQIPQNSRCTASDRPSLKPSKSDEQDMWNTTGKVRMNLWHSPVDPIIRTSRCWTTSKNLSPTGLYGHRMKSRGPAECDGQKRQMERKRVRKICGSSITWWWYIWERQQLDYQEEIIGKPRSVLDLAIKCWTKSQRSNMSQGAYSVSWWPSWLI